MIAVAVLLRFTIKKSEGDPEKPTLIQNSKSDERKLTSGVWVLEEAFTKAILISHKEPYVLRTGGD